MSWIGIASLAVVFIILLAQLASYSRGYKKGYEDGVKEANLLADLKEPE